MALKLECDRCGSQEKKNGVNQIKKTTVMVTMEGGEKVEIDNEGHDLCRECRGNLTASIRRALTPVAVQAAAQLVDS